MAKKLNKEDFYNRVMAIHNGKYEYFNDFVNTRSDISVLCPIHGKFFITAKRHLNGQGCPKCGKEYARTCRKGNWSNFIDRADRKFSKSLSFPNNLYTRFKMSCTIVNTRKNMRMKNQ